MEEDGDFRSKNNGQSDLEKSNYDEGHQVSLQAQANTQASLQAHDNTQASYQLPANMQGRLQAQTHSQASLQAQTSTERTGGGCDMEVSVNSGTAGSAGCCSSVTCNMETSCVGTLGSRLASGSTVASPISCKREQSCTPAPCSFMEMMSSGLGAEDSVGEMNGSLGSAGSNGCSPRQFYGHHMSMQPQPHYQHLHYQQVNHAQFQSEYLYQQRRQEGPYGSPWSLGGPRQVGNQQTPGPSQLPMGGPYQVGNKQTPGPSQLPVGGPHQPSTRPAQPVLVGTQQTTGPSPTKGLQPNPAAHLAHRPIKQEADARMSLWAKTQQLSPESLTQVRNAYGTQFPLEVRHFFAQWIEEQAWADLCENVPEHDQYAMQLLTKLIEQIEARAQDGDLDWLTKLNLNETAKHFRDWYSGNPMTLVRIVRTCLATEQALVNKETCQPDAMDGQVEQNEQLIFDNIRKTINLLEERTNSTEQDLRRMQLDQEKFVIDYQKNIKIQNNLQQLKAMPQDPACVEASKKLQAEKNAMDQQLLAAGQQLLQQRLDLAQKHKETLAILDNLQKQVVDDELIKWKRRQQLAGNGAPFDHTLIDTIQTWCEALAQLIWENRRQILQVDMLHSQIPIKNPQGTADIQTELNKVVTGLLSSLVTSTFIVEHQPPQVMKKDARFQATVRLLVGGKLHLQMNPPRVKATIISEQQARGLLQSEEGRRTQKCGEILNNEAPMDYHQHSGQLSICFRNMSLKHIKRADRRGADVHCVAEEKFCILFSSDFNVGGNELNFQVWTLSLPVVVTVHGNQECQATATYLWDNQFSEPGRTPFVVPDIVPWREFASMLKIKFQAMTGRGLSDSNLQYLAHKLLGYNGSQDLNTMTVSWTQFNKENLPGRNFTFWEWFWSIGKLVKEHLKGLWNDGCIHGFIEKNESQELLMARPNGTFLARFSDGTLGGVTIAWVADHDIAGERQVWNLLPFTIKDFAIRGLADRVKDLKSLITLFPDIPKDNVFQKYYTPMPELSAQPPGSYVKTSLITVIDHQPSQPHSAPMNYDNPQTPQAYSEQPFSPTNSTAKGDTASLMESLMQDDFQVASPDANIDLNFEQLNKILDSGLQST